MLFGDVLKKVKNTPINLRLVNKQVQLWKIFSNLKHCKNKSTNAWKSQFLPQSLAIGARLMTLFLTSQETMKVKTWGNINLLGVENSL